MHNSIYAAYGSNLNFAQMALRCPDARTLSEAKLEGYELVFRGSPNHAVATIEPKVGSSVPIMLWTISESDEQALDRYEGYPHFYDKQEMVFRAGHEPVSAKVYVMTPGHCAGKPSKGYLDTILEGYRDCGFDTSCLEMAMQRSRELMQQEAASGHNFRFF